MGVGLVVLAIALFALNGDAIADEQQYARDGQLADALIVGKAIKRSMRADSTEAQIEFAVTYRFTVAGKRVEGEHIMPRDAWDRAGGSIAHLAYHLGAIRQINQAARGPVGSTVESP